MSWDWVDRDLTEWAKKTLPEFLLISMQDPGDKNECIALTPWGRYEVCVGEVQVEGEATLTGKKAQSLFQFELDIGVRIDIEREGRDDYWPGVVQMVSFDNCNLNPPIVTQLEELPAAVAAEVEWYVTEGMGKQYLWHALERWHAYAVKKWTQNAAPGVRDPYSSPQAPPSRPPFKEAARPAGGARVGEHAAGRQGVPYIGKKLVHPIEPPYRSPPSSGDEEPRTPDATAKRKKFGRYPFLPSMLAGVAGPSSEGLRPKEHAVGRPEWFQTMRHGGEAPGDELALNNLDILLHRARAKRAEYDLAPQERQLQLRAGELCEAIEKGEIMKAFSRLDDETVNCAHPETGRLAAHYCVARGSKELLQMIIEAKAQLDLKDAAGQTPLMAAAKLGNAELSKVLLDAGADPTEEDALGRTAKDMVDVLPMEDRPLKNWRKKVSGEAVAEDPARKTHELRGLIDGRERPKKYGTLLINAIGQKDFRTAESAIEAGGDLSLTDEKGDTALLLLAKGKWKDGEALQVRLAERACRAGAAVNAQNAQGNAPLLFAAHRGGQALVEALLKLRADPALANGEGNTALMYAAHGGHEAICGVLLEAFSPTSVRNRFGLTAEETALRRGFRSCAVLIQAYAMAPKRADAAAEAPRRKEKKKEEGKLAFDYSKWNSLEREMQQEEELEESTRRQEQQQLAKRPVPKIDDLGPEAFGLPADTPWPPADPGLRRKGPFDYSRWDKIVDDIEKRESVQERYEHLQKNPQYEWRDGQKLQVIF